jgi:hypothetical protein
MKDHLDVDLMLQTEVANRRTQFSMMVDMVWVSGMMMTNLLALENEEIAGLE